MKPRRNHLLLLGAISLTLATPSAIAANLYWDTNGTGSTGSGAATGTWGTSVYWSTDSTGLNVGPVTLTAATTSADDLFFSAGTNGTGGTVTVNSTRTASLLTLEEGALTFFGGTISLAGGGGITVLAGAGNAIISSNLTVSGNNIFNVGSGRTLTLNTGTFTRSAGATVNIQGLGSGSSTMTNLSTNVNNIIGPWASIGTGASTTYAKFSGTSLSGLGYTGTTDGSAVTASSSVSSTAGTVNYTLNAVGTLGASANVNTLRYTGAAGTLVASTSFTTKGVMNVGGNLLSLNGVWTTGASGTEMVMNTANGDIRLVGASASLTGTITKTGSGTFTLGSGTGSNFSGIGGITVNEGTFITNAVTANQLVGATINSGGTLQWAGSNKHQDNALFTINAGGTLDLNTFSDTIGAIAGAGSITSATTATLALSGGTQTFSGLIGGAVALNLNLSPSSSALTLTGANTYTGATNINAGSLLLGYVSALGGNTPGVNGTSSISMATGTTLRSTVSGVTVSAPTTTTGSVTIGAPDNDAGQAFSELILNGAIGGAGTSNVDFRSFFNKNTIQTVTLGAASNYAGTTTIGSVSAGTDSQVFVKLGIDNALPTTTILSIQGGTGNGSGRGAGLNLFGFNQTLAGLTNTAASLRVQEVVNSNVSAYATLTINGSTDTTYSGNLGRNSAGFSVNATAMPGSTNGNNFGLTKDGIGKFTLAGTNTYTGDTVIKAGTLQINSSTSIGSSSKITVGDAGSSGTVLDATTAGLTVGASQTLAGIGQVLATGQTVSIAGTLAPGNSPGTLSMTVGTLDLGNATALAFELNPSDTTVGSAINDLVAVTGNLNLDGLLSVVATSGDFLSVVANTTWRLFNYSGALTDDTLFLGSMPSLGSGLSWSINTATTGQVNLVVIPEPGAALLGGLGLLALLRRHRN